MHGNSLKRKVWIAPTVATVAFLAEDTEPKAVGVGTYARHIPNAIAFGIQAPWQADQCHQANEHAAVTDYLQWIQIMKESIMAAGEFI